MRYVIASVIGSFGIITIMLSLGVEPIATTVNAPDHVAVSAEMPDVILGFEDMVSHDATLPDLFAFGELPDQVPTVKEGKQIEPKAIELLPPGRGPPRLSWNPWFTSNYCRQA